MLGLLEGTAGASDLRSAAPVGLLSAEIEVNDPALDEVMDRVLFVGLVWATIGAFCASSTPPNSNFLAAEEAFDEVEVLLTLLLRVDSRSNRAGLRFFWCAGLRGESSDSSTSVSTALVLIQS